MEKEILETLSNLRSEVEDLKKVASFLNNEEPSDKDKITVCSTMNCENTGVILDKMEEGNSLENAFNKVVRPYSDALTMCAQNGRTLDNDFMHEFTTHHVNATLNICANLFIAKGVAKNKDSLDFLKSKIRECLVYIDNL